MLYKPKYCCQCGEQIERVVWKFWTSRRFCEFCETEVGHYDWMPRIALGVGIALSIVGLGSYIQTPEKSLEVAPRQFVGQTQLKNNIAEKPSNLQLDTKEGTVIENSDATSGVEVPTKQNDLSTKRVAGQKEKNEYFEVSQNKTDEPVYFCGAETKKGTACSRRVKGGGRCWQHKGREAMLPQEELLVNR